MGTTKLTRKEIMAEDPVHEALIGIVETFKAYGVTIALIAGSVALLGIGVYFGLQYLESRETLGQKQLAKGIAYFHAQINAEAPDDPFAKGSTAMFRSAKARNEAARSEFSSILSKHKYCKLAVLTRYYLGLTQLKLEQKKEGIENLQLVSKNSKDPMVGDLAKRAMAGIDYADGDYKGSQEILQGMIQDPKCELLKEDLKIELSRALAAQGQRDQAIKVLTEARDQSGTSLLQSQISQELTKLQGSSEAGSKVVKTISVKP